MTTKDVQKAISEITGRNLMGKEQEALATFIWNAIENCNEETYRKAMDAIDFLYMADRISLAATFELANIFG